MPDREKVISAYECVITRGKSVCECGKCDYHINDSSVFFCDNQRVLTDALALLKEQDELYKNMVLSWLCEIAINNVDCNRDMTFLDAVEDILDRASSGLKQYFIDKQGGW